MFLTIEISNPFQWKPGFWRCEGVTSWRIWWAWFAVSCHPMRYDEMIDLAGSGAFAWHKSRPTPLAVDFDYMAHIAGRNPQEYKRDVECSWDETAKATKA